MVADGSVLPPSPTSLTLHEATLTWGHPDLLSELQRLDDEGASKISLSAVLGREEPSDRLAYPYLCTLDALRTQIFDQLRAGELVATGFEEGMPADAPPKAIQAERWNVLRPNFEISSASGSGITLSNIRVSAAPVSRIAPIAGAAGINPKAATWTLVVNRHGRGVRIGSRKVSLSERVSKLLLLLVEAATSDRRLVTSKEIEQRLWGKSVMSRNACADAVRDLRIKLSKVLPKGEPVQTLVANRRPAAYVLDLDPIRIRIDPD